MQIMLFIRKLENTVVSDLVVLDKYLITNNKLKISKTLRVSLDTEYRRSPGPVSLAKRGLGDHAGQVVHKVVHETVRVAAPRPVSLRGRRPLLIDTQEAVSDHVIIYLNFQFLTICL